MNNENKNCLEHYFVDSSFIKHLSFDEQTNFLIVSFASGSIWLYKSITLEVYNRFVNFRPCLAPTND